MAASGGRLDEKGFVLTGGALLSDDGSPHAGWPLHRPPFLLETSVPGVSRPVTAGSAP